MADKVTAPRVRGMKGTGRKIVFVTAYDAVTGQIADSSGVDAVLVGDSVGNVVLGFDSTLPVTLETMVHHTRAVRAGVRRALLVADLPFGSYQSSPAQAVDSAVALMRAGAEAVKLEGPHGEAIAAIVRAGIPVVGHVGMTPQSHHAFGGFRVQGRGDGGPAVRDDLERVEAAGVFATVLELIPAALAAELTAHAKAPTIGIGAGPDCDGQIQVFHDVTGLTTGRYRHAKRYAHGYAAFVRALKRYAAEVRDGAFPNEENSF